MKYLLIPGGFVVLAGRSAVTAVDLFEGNRHLPRRLMDMHGDVRGQAVDVLDVAVGDDDDVSGIIRPPMRGDQRGDVVVPVKNVV